MLRIFGICLLFLFSMLTLSAEDGYELWLRYPCVTDAARLKDYQSRIQSVFLRKSSPTREIIAAELEKGFSGLLGKSIPASAKTENGTLIIATADEDVMKQFQEIKSRVAAQGREGYLIQTQTTKGKTCIIITANSDIGLLYGSFHFLRLLQTASPLQAVAITSTPKINHRLLNHWDNLDRTVERGYAGFSLWDWHKLPDYIDPRYQDYARANASVGINGTVVTNVNANALVLTRPYLEKVQALANVFRPYGIRVYLTARFSAPIEIGKLPTADPLDPDVRRWWQDKAKEIYSLIPDFGGFLVKANSEGQPGPQNYKRSHADGANMLAEAVQPFGGIVMWRAFVYANEDKTDRVKQAYNEFVPLDGKFLPNVIVQVKNGPLDFQPREPFHPLFGATPQTPLMMEFQLTQEYLGFATHLVYLPTLFGEVLDSDTFIKGEGSTVRKVIDGTLFNDTLTAIAGVSNIGNDRNWCGHPFAQANWYAYGRMAWNPDADVQQLANEWTSMTFTTNDRARSTIVDMMMRSREITVNYMTPLGLHHIMGWSHHYGPAPWIANKQREDWTSVYYHKADSLGVGFDRTKTGSNALEQYHPRVQKIYEDAKTCPDEYLLWFHHLPWTFRMKSGKTLWDELCYHYYSGAKDVSGLQTQWQSVKNAIDPERFDHITTLLKIQEKEARWWRDACVLYFQSFSKQKIPDDLEKPENDLKYYQSQEFPYAPGIRPGW